MNTKDNFVDSVVATIAEFVVDNARSRADQKLVAEADAVGNEFDAAVIAGDGRKAKECADRWIAAWRRVVASVKPTETQPSLF